MSSPICLISWIGLADLKQIDEPETPGPLLSVLQHKTFDVLYLLHNQPAAEVKPFVKALQRRYKGEIIPWKAKLKAPIHFADIYIALNAALAKAFRGELGPQDPNDEPASKLLARMQVERKKSIELEIAAKKVKAKREKR